jgi:hypothetical protein
MKANVWAGRNKVEVREVPDPGILNSRDAIVKVSSTAICGSDLHLLDGYVPTMQNGDIMGHEFMGEVVEVGSGVAADRLRVGDRVVVPFPIACGACGACAAELYSCCENSNPNAGIAEKMFGQAVTELNPCRAEPDRGGRPRDESDGHRRRHPEDAGVEVVLGEPVTRVPELLAEAREIDGVLDGVGGSGSGTERDEIQYSEWDARIRAMPSTGVSVERWRHAELRSGSARRSTARVHTVQS